MKKATFSSISEDRCQIPDTRFLMTGAGGCGVIRHQESEDWYRAARSRLSHCTLFDRMLSVRLIRFNHLMKGRNETGVDCRT